LHYLRDAGFNLGIADGGGIRVAPAGQLTDADRQGIRDHKSELLVLLARPTAELVKAINACCDARGDDDANRAGLIAECSALTTAGQADMREHFEQQTAIWRGAARGDQELGSVKAERMQS
jgi:hypothetical protein